MGTHIKQNVDEGSKCQNKNKVVTYHLVGGESDW